MRTKFGLRLEKNKRISGQFLQITVKKFNFLCRTWKLYGKHFFQKKISNQFFLPPVCSTVLKKRQTWFNFFLLFFENVCKLYDKHFLHTLGIWNCMIIIFVLWNCMINIFGAWRSNRLNNKYIFRVVLNEGTLILKFETS